MKFNMKEPVWYDRKEVPKGMKSVHEFGEAVGYIRGLADTIGPWTTIEKMFRYMSDEQVIQLVKDIKENESRTNPNEQ
tara:strand:- start:955 stop:1188 length:234 start_codon:yes stop_codon:yes gene_type:complete